MKKYGSVLMITIFLFICFTSCQGKTVSEIDSTSSSNLDIEQSKAPEEDANSDIGKDFDYSSVVSVVTIWNEADLDFVTFKPDGLEEMKEGADLIIRCQVDGEQMLSTSERYMGIGLVTYFFHTPVKVLDVYKGAVRAGESLEITGRSGYVPEVIYWGTQEQREKILTNDWYGIYSEEQKYDVIKKVHYDHVPLSTFSYEKAWFKMISEKTIMVEDKEYIVFLKDLTDTDGTVYHFPYGEESIVEDTGDIDEVLGALEDSSEIE